MQYAQAMNRSTAVSTPSPALAELIAHEADLEAAELALRRRDPHNPLTQRFQTACYLAEARPEHYGVFVNEKAAFLPAWLSLSGHALRTAWKYLKGLYLLRKHHAL